MRRWSLTILSLLMWGAGLAFSPAIRAEATPRVLVVSSEGLPYTQVQASMVAKLKASVPGAVVQIVPIEAVGVVGSMKIASGDVAVALGAAAVQALSVLSLGVPLVQGMVLSGEPNVSTRSTTVSLAFPEELEMAWLRRLLPKARTVGVLYGDSGNAVVIDRARVAAEALGLRFEERRVKNPRALPQSLSSLERVADVIWALPDSVVYTPQSIQQILVFGFRNRIPLIGLSESWVKAGALYALSWDYQDIGVQCAERVTAILHGAEPSDLAEVGPRKAVVVVNEKTALHMRVAIPSDVPSIVRLKP